MEVLLTVPFMYFVISNNTHASLITTAAHLQHIHSTMFPLVAKYSMKLIPVCYPKALEFLSPSNNVTSTETWLLCSNPLTVTKGNFVGPGTSTKIWTNGSVKLYPPPYSAVGSSPKRALNEKYGW